MIGSFYTANTVAADDPTVQGAKASASMALV